MLDRVTTSETIFVRLWAGLIAVAAAACASALWFLEAQHLPANLLFADPAKATHAPFYLGFFSCLGLILWTAAAVASGAGAQLAHGDPRTHALGRFLAGAAGISLVLLVDDWLMLHDHVGPHLIHVPQKVFYAAYGLMVLAWLWAGRRVVLETPAVYLAAAIAFGMVSVAVDTLAPRSNLAVVAEDGTKLLAILSWTFYFTRVSSRLITARSA